MAEANSASMIRKKANSETKVLAVVPSDPLQAYVEKGRGNLLESYYNPGSYFDKVYCLSPLEKTAGFKYGMHIIPTTPQQLPSRIRELGIDIVRAYGGYWACDMACENKVDEVPVIVSVHDTNPKLLHDSILNADYVLSVSNAVKELLLNKGVSPQRIYDLANRADLRVFNRCCDEKLRAEFYARYPGKYRVLHVGRKSEQKNLDTLIRALGELGPEYTCMFAGKGKAEPYQLLAKENGVLEQCYFIESVPNAELARYYSFCDCMCTPSRWEGFGIVFIEAMACKAVVVTSDIAPMNEYITNNVSGILVKDFENPLALADAIVQACTDKSLRKHIQSNARKAAEPFSQERVDQLEVTLYKKFLNEPVQGTKVNSKVKDNILKKNPWYIGSQFEWAEKPSIRPIYQRRFDYFIRCIGEVRKRLGPTLRMLDVGCGDGYWLHRFKDMEGLHLTGVDYNPVRVERAKRVVPQITIHLCDIMDFETEEPFDVILLSQMIEHVEDDMGLLYKMRTLLSENGVLILGIPNEGSSLHQMRRQKLGESYKTDHVHFYVEGEIVERLQRAGFFVHNVMREVFYIGDDNLYYNLLEYEWGFQLLELMTFLIPSECSDFYFECRPHMAGDLPRKEYHPPELPTVQEIAQKLKQFGEQIQNIPDYLEESNTGYQYLLNQTERLKVAHYLSRLPAYRVLTEANLDDESLRKSPELAAKLRTAGLRDTNLENYWKRVSFIAENCQGRVLELGCGCGNITRYISQSNKVSYVCAIDMQREYIEQLCAYGFDKVEPVCADILTYRFSERFDCVVIAELIEHLTIIQELKLIGKLCAILERGTTLIITTPIGFMPDPDHVRGFTTSEFRQHLRQYYGKIVKTGSNGIQQFAVVSFEPFLAQKSNPRVSVILPTFNHLRFLPKAVESVLAQTYDDFELIIVNDGSTDGTREYLDSLQDSRITVIHQENKRLPEALNTGFRAARGKLLTWVSSDNYCSPIFLEALVAALDAFPDAGLACSAYARIDEDGQITCVSRDQDLSYHSVLAANPGIVSFIYRRDCQEKVGMYDTELEGAEDWDMWIRIIEQYQTVYVPEVLCYYRQHSDSMTNKIPEKVFRAGRRTFQKAINRRNNKLNLVDLYPTLGLCRDKEVAKLYASFNLGTAFLHSPLTQVEFACQAFETVLSMSPHSFEAIGNLAVAYGRSGQWDKSMQLVQRLKGVNHPIAQNICGKLTEAHHVNKPDLLIGIPLFVLNKQDIELFQLEKEHKCVFSFTNTNRQGCSDKYQDKIGINPDELMKLAETACAGGQYGRAARCYYKVLQCNPNDIELWNKMGDLAIRFGDSGTADKAFKHARILERLGKRAEGVASVRQYRKQGQNEELYLGQEVNDQGTVACLCERPLVWELNKIPKKAHFYWGNEAISFLRYLTIYSFRRLNPDWEVNIYIPLEKYKGDIPWETGELYDGVSFKGKDYTQELFNLEGINIREIDFSSYPFIKDAAENYKSDMFRWYILSREGGLYSDVDILYFKPMNYLFFNLKEKKNLDVALCLQEWGHIIGFLLSSEGNPFFKELLLECERFFNDKNYQSISAPMVNALYPTMDCINKMFPDLVFQNMPMSVVYAVAHHNIPEVFCSGDLSCLKPETIGIHWYAGNPVSQEFNNELTSENFLNYDNIITKKIKEIYPYNSFD